MDDLAIDDVTPRFSPDGAFIAGKKAVYRLADHVSLGGIALSPDWRHACAIERAPSPIRLKQLNLTAAAKTLCGNIDWIVYNPDLRMAAMRCYSDEIYILNTKDGALSRTLATPSHKTIQEACWSDRGLAVLAGADTNPPQDSYSDDSSLFTLYVWHDFNRPPAGVEIQKNRRAEFLFDPQGRYLVAMLHNLFQRTLQFIDLQTLQQVESYEMSAGHSDGCDPAVQLDDYWIPGRAPILQTIETVTGCSDDHVTRHRIYASPSSWGVSSEVVKTPPDRYAGKPNDSDIPNRFSRGPYLDTLLRQRDGVMLTFADHSVYAADGLFDCRGACSETTAMLADWVFRLGEEANHGAVVFGQQVMHRLRHPGLVADFLAGKEVSFAATFQRPVGPPPLLEIRSPAASAGPVAPGSLLLRVTDQGGGVSGIRIWQGFDPVGNLLPIPADYWVLWSLPDSTLRCQPGIKLSACNHDDTLCSMWIQLPNC